MLESLELGLFGAATALYALAWGWHFVGWKRGSAAHTGIAKIQLPLLAMPCPQCWKSSTVRIARHSSAIVDKNS